MSQQPSSPQSAKKPLLEQMRDALRVRHYSIRTETSYLDWVKRFTLRVFHHKRHPQEMGSAEIEASRSVTHRAVERHLAAGGVAIPSLARIASGAERPGNDAGCNSLSAARLLQD